MHKIMLLVKHKAARHLAKEKCSNSRNSSLTKLYNNKLKKCRKDSKAKISQLKARLNLLSNPKSKMKIATVIKFHNQLWKS
jgi:hypothetical protein